MAEQTPAENPEAQALGDGSYEIIRGRLQAQAKALREKSRQLNEKREALFGGTQLSVAGNERIRTEHNCVPRDILNVGGRLLFGYNVFLGLKRETQISDVFSLHGLARKEGDEGFDFPVDNEGMDALFGDERFQRDFTELYQYYRDAKLAQLRVVGGKLLAIFQITDNARDVKVLRWALDGAGDGGPRYLDNRGEPDHVFPTSHDFEWRATTREEHVTGVHPHVNILDEVFVETVGGDLTVKIEDNTEDGEGIWREAVEDPDQGLDDAQIEYARVGHLILIRVLPYREETWRYLVFNTRSHDVQRIDAIGLACRQLPEDHGIIFPGGYYLQDGETRRFEGDVQDMEFMQMLRSPNGEDVLYVFHERRSGRSVLLPYNLIRKEVHNPLQCHGYSLFDDGLLVVFRGDEDTPTRVHHMQLWQTAFTSDEFAAKQQAEQAQSGSFLHKVGNAELVRGVSDAMSIVRAVENQAPTMQIYEDLIADTRRVLENYFWLDAEEVFDLRSTLQEIVDTAELVIDEFEKVTAIREAARNALAEAEEKQSAVLAEIRPDIWKEIDAYVEGMAKLRSQRGQLISLKEMRYIDVARLDTLEQAVAERFDHLGKETGRFLLGDEALAPYRRTHGELTERVEGVEQSHDIPPITEAIDGAVEGLDLLTELVGGLKIDDAAARTRILEEISEVFALFNRSRALLEQRRRSILDREGVAEFGAQFKLFGQSVQSALQLCDSPEKCDEQLTRLMVQLEELEGRFSEFDQFLGDLAAKREEVYEAIGARKQSLLDERQRRAQNTAGAAERILKGLSRRAQSFETLDALNAWFSTDPMVLKVRELSERLVELGDNVRSEEMLSRLKQVREEAGRALRDRSELFEGGGDLLRFGKHRFRVNTQSLELTMVRRDEGMALNLGGTDFYETLTDEGVEAARPYWEQQYPSETDIVYRGEHLAASMLFDAEARHEGLTLEGLHDAALSADETLEAVRRYAASRYDEGYERGVHDVDAAQILGKLLALQSTAGLLRYGPQPRALACLWWAHEVDAEARTRLHDKARSLARLHAAFGDSRPLRELGDEMAEAMGPFLSAARIEHGPADLEQAGHYLAEELGAEDPRFVTSAEAAGLRDALLGHLSGDDAHAGFADELADNARSLRDRHALARAWLRAFVDASNEDRRAGYEAVLPEAAALLCTGPRLEREISGALGSVEIEGLLGQHARLRDGKLTLRLDEFLTRLGRHLQVTVPGYEAWRRTRTEVLERERARLRLDEFRPRVLSSFVRNKLINDVYLPIIGDNLAKQMGAVGDQKRTDLMGMLLLISPPGYGKTTLMEYIANRLGLVFMKVNGPSLGHEVTSLDPREAGNATAAQEVDKINLALEMGNNVMLYLDDIQHTHPELLQKFISLCDATRRIEGVWKGRTRTYDLRGKRFCVVMAGNPYTESGDKFQIPDMLANRADTYNLGDILEGRDEAFALSYIENALTSNAVLAPLATREQADVYTLIKMARGEEVPASELSHNYAGAELEEIKAILQRMFRCQEVLLAVNTAYIASASMDDQYRTEPPFKLQGSYRNMNKLAEKLVAVMNAEELEALIDDHYQGEAQTLTTGAEQNLLKLAELRGTLEAEQSARWEEIKSGFRRVQRMGGAEDDPATRVASTLSALGQGLEEIRDGISTGVAHLAEVRSAAPMESSGDDPLEALVARMDATLKGLAEAKLNLKVVNQPPPGVMQLFRRHIGLIESLLLPLLEAAEKGLHGDKDSWRRVHEALETLKSLDQLESLQTPSEGNLTVEPLGGGKAKPKA